MKVLHSISGLGHNSGGPSQSTSVLVEGLWKLNVDAILLAYDVDENDTNVLENDRTFFVEQPKEKKFLYSKAYQKKLSSFQDIELYHIHAIWQYPSVITAAIAYNKQKPYIITPRGMLYPQALKEGSVWLKKFMLKYVFLRDLQRASCVHATCIEEMKHLRNLGIKSPVAVIPNPVDDGNYYNLPVQSPKKRRIGYLGRVHPRKNIERLIYAWEKIAAETTNSELVIIGDGEPEYMEFLKNEAQKRKLKNVIFTGFLKGKAKEKTLLSLSYLAVPSDFENFGMIIAEALMLGIPVIASKGTPWQELETHQCGWWIDNDVKTIAQTFQLALQLQEEERVEMGKRGKELIHENYTPDVIAQKMLKLYGWILNNEEKPGFVFLTEKTS